MPFLAAIPVLGPMLAGTAATTAAGMAAGSVAGLSAATAGTAGLIGAGGAIGAGGLLTAGTLSSLVSLAGLGATGLSAMGQLKAGDASMEAAKLNAEQMEQQAGQVRESAKGETFKLSRARNRMIGEQTALYGASGVRFEGSPLEVMAQTASEYERDILYSGYTGDVNALNAINRGNTMLWQGDQGKSASKWAAGSTLLTGLMDYGTSRMPYRYRRGEL